MVMADPIHRRGVSLLTTLPLSSRATPGPILNHSGRLLTRVILDDERTMPCPPGETLHPTTHLPPDPPPRCRQAGGQLFPAKDRVRCAVPGEWPDRGSSRGGR
jgi:hypothetical protein